MTRTRKIGAIAAGLLTTSALLIPAALQAAAPTSPNPAAPAAKRSPAAIQKDLQTTQAKIGEIMTPDPALFAKAEFRNGDGRKVLPHLQKMASLLEEVERADIDQATTDQARRSRYLFMAYTVALGDKENEARLRAGSQKKDTKDAVAQAAWLSIGQWFGTSADATAQQQILDDITALAKANQSNDDVVSVMMVMSQVGAASPDLARKAGYAARVNSTPAFANQSMEEAFKAQTEMLGKPFTVGGRTSTDGTFDSSAYRGKVVMIDFWATWCGPCIAGLPEIKEVYKSFHDQGFEIVGVSCDLNETALNNFTKQNDMPWVQLRELSQTGSEEWHPIAKENHVLGIPQMFLIDRKGVLRYVDARADMAKKIKELLAEPAAEKPK